VSDKRKISPLPWGVNARDEKDGPPYEVWTNAGSGAPIGSFTRIEDAVAAVGCVNAAVDGVIDTTLQAQRFETMRQHYDHRLRVLLSALLPFAQEYESAILVPVGERRSPRASITEFKRAFEAIKCPPSALDCGEPGCEVEP
jgi:hypothetical protein